MVICTSELKLDVSRTTCRDQGKESINDSSQVAEFHSQSNSTCGHIYKGFELSCEKADDADFDEDEQAGCATRSVKATRVGSSVIGASST